MSESFTSDSDLEGYAYTPDASVSSLEGSASMIEIPPPTPSHDSALSSVSENGSDSDSDGGYNDAEEEWQESLRQLELLMGMVIVPFFGKWVGRRTAYWTWAKFMTWKYPVDVVITNRAAFNLAGAVSAVSAPL
ncbi:uncharacterized protein LAJ45_02533 [Morchella importuna]|uniref:Uncharacterized protein n=1 Tax=Morchella conica CCBAS932 TaxID=1392247 RepID=A0A3N4L2R5_9PEZI|nr:uncharacterized protein LAJ45_02533 [Morchella importuna]KAH8153720.1 hypothetical protein LAJ45_02533 [Morchella importuna]KAI5851419.1 hypothetical protein DFP73DRAFT_590679 [Morchella snyderi]RPB14871.1 hypothetical protein P167DRAFT_563569 [Morchella conica CCBAS932]